MLLLLWLARVVRCGFNRRTDPSTGKVRATAICTLARSLVLAVFERVWSGALEATLSRMTVCVCVADRLTLEALNDCSCRFRFERTETDVDSVGKELVVVGLVVDEQLDQARRLLALRVDDSRAGLDALHLELLHEIGIQKVLGQVDVLDDQLEWLRLLRNRLFQPAVERVRWPCARKNVVCRFVVRGNYQIVPAKFCELNGLSIQVWKDSDNFLGHLHLTLKKRRRG